jgi:pimeloyl-ACP methyl ester carboxylesterase
MHTITRRTLITILRRLAMLVAALCSLLLIAALLARDRLAQQVVARRGPGRPAQDPTQEVLSHWGVNQQFRVDVGPPSASLLVWVLEPPGEVEATVIVLHGIAVDMESMLRVGIPQAALAQSFRVVLVEPRGHGLSSGDRITFGAAEAPDLSRVVDALSQKNLVTGRLGVYGLSYGAALALQFAGQEPRVGGVVAVAPYRSLRAVAPAYIGAFLPVVGALVPNWYINDVIDRAGRNAGFDPDAASPEAAMARIEVPVLLVHGINDQHIPPSHSEALREVRRERVDLRIVQGVDHFTVVGTEAAKGDAFHWLRNVLTGRSGAAAEH